MLTFIPEGLVRYCESHSTPPSPVFKTLEVETREKTQQTEMLVGPIEGTFLKLLARSIGARRILEIGTFTGYSALMLAEGTAEGGEVITCELNPKHAKIAEAHWAQSPHGSKIRLELGNALDTVERIEGPLDMVFVDADKENYIAYWEKCVPLVRRGGLLLADNVLWSGRVLNPQAPIEQAVAAFNEHVLEDNRVELVMLTIRDGITLACKK